MGEEERLLVEVFYGLNDGSVQTAAKRFLEATFISNEGLQHGANHVELQEKRTGFQNTFPNLFIICIV